MTTTWLSASTTSGAAGDEAEAAASADKQMRISDHGKRNGPLGKKSGSHKSMEPAGLGRSFGGPAEKNQEAT
jgi:hypothetical protein